MRGRRRQRGQALLVALMILFLTSFAIVLLGADIGLRQRMALREVRRFHLAVLVDGAVAEALAGLAADPGYSGASTHPLGRGSISSSVDWLGKKRYRIYAEASFGDHQRAVEVEVELASGTPEVTAFTRVPVEAEW